jgi:hypothetical protein
MPELAEGARLEIVCSAKSGTVGSNPTLSARNFAQQNLLVAFSYWLVARRYKVGYGKIYLWLKAVSDKLLAKS